MQAEQERIEGERAATERWSEAARLEVEEVDQALKDALALIDLATAPYLIANPVERRLINLAIYLMLLVSYPDTIQAKPNAFYAQLVTLARQLAKEVAQERQKRPRDGQSPGSQPQDDRSPVFRGSGSQLVQMAEREGFEPSNEVSPVTRFPVAPVQPLRHLSRRLGRGDARLAAAALKATTPARCAVARLRAMLLAASAAAQQGHRPARHLHRDRHHRQHHRRLHRRPGPRRAPAEPGIRSQRRQPPERLTPLAAAPRAALR